MVIWRKTETNGAPSTIVCVLFRLFNRHFGTVLAILHNSSYVLYLLGLPYLWLTSMSNADLESDESLTQATHGTLRFGHDE